MVCDRMSCFCKHEDTLARADFSLILSITKSYCLTILTQIGRLFVYIPNVSIMSRIEELPDDHDETSFTPKPTNPSLPNATKLISSPTSADTPISVPPLPPILSADDPSKKTVDEVAADLKKSPFFMTSTDEAADPDNIELEAMRALMYEGTRLEIAIGFREQGTEMAKAKKWADAKEFYYKALLALRVERKEGEAWTEGVGSKEEEEAKERGCKEICLVNRALCHMELSKSLTI